MRKGGEGKEGGRARDKETNKIGKVLKTAGNERYLIMPVSPRYGC